MSCNADRFMLKMTRVGGAIGRSATRAACRAGWQRLPRRRGRRGDQVDAREIGGHLDLQREELLHLVRDRVHALHREPGVVDQVPKRA
jgi:hypothetical protein